MRGFRRVAQPERPVCSMCDQRPRLVNEYFCGSCAAAYIIPYVQKHVKYPADRVREIRLQFRNRF